MRWRIALGILLMVALIMFGQLVDADDFTVQISNDGLVNEDFRRCEQAVRSAMTWVPDRHMKGLKNVILHNHENWRRGLADKDIIYLRCLNDLAELKSVFIHELGHVVDLNLVRQNAQLNYFSEISWIDTEVMLVDYAGFVSGYAKTNTYEDFAETYAYYVLHGEKFRILAATNTLNKRKYDFMMYVIFAGLEFNLENNQLVLTSRSETDSIGSEYDVTRIGYKR